MLHYEKKKIDSPVEPGTVLTEKGALDGDVESIEHVTASPWGSLVAMVWRSVSSAVSSCTIVLSGKLVMVGGYRKRKGNISDAAVWCTFLNDRRCIVIKEIKRRNKIFRFHILFRAL